MVARRARLLGLVYGAGWFVAGVLAILLAAGAIDVVLRLSDPGVRLILSGAALAAIVAWGGRTVWPAARTRRSERAVARRIEQMYPQLRDRLSSALDFLHQDTSPEHGSLQLREAVVRETAAAASTLDFSRCLNPAPARRGAAAALLAAVAAVALVALNSPVAAHAARRLAVPWGGPEWPRRNQLRYVDPPSRVARGAELVVRIADDGPETAQAGLLWLWHDGDQESEVESLPLLREGKLLTARLPAVTRGLRYRAEAGDGELPWRQVELIEPPQLLSWRLQATPPDYAGGGAREVGLKLEALRGTQLSLRAELSRPMHEARLVTSRGQQIRLQHAEGPEERATVTLNTPWTLEETASFRLWLEVEDQQGVRLRVGPHVEVVVRDDTPPVVSLELPGDGHWATPAADLPLRGLVKDNVGLQQVTLYAELPGELQRTIELEQFATPAEAPAAASIQQLLPLGPWGLRPGDELLLRVEATDFLDQTGVSSQRRVRVISLEELLQRAGRQQSAVFEKLDELVELQRAARSRNDEVLRGLGQTLGERHREQLQSVELQQRRVAEGLSDEPTGLRGMIRSTLADLQLNGAAVSDLSQRLEELGRQTQRLAEDEAARAERELVAAVRGAAIGSPADGPMQRLRQARVAQTDLLEALQLLLDDARRWTSYQQAAEELTRLIDRQLEVQQQTDQLQLTLLSEPQNPQLDAQSRTVADEQAELGRRLDKLLTRLDELTSRIEPQDRRVVQQALATAEARRVSSTIRRSADLIQRQYFGQALDAQQQTVTDLRAVLEVLVQRAAAATTGELLQLAEDLRQLQRRADDEAARLAQGQLEPGALRALADSAQQKAVEVEAASRVAGESAALGAMQLEQAARDLQADGDQPSRAEAADRVRRGRDLLAEAATQLEAVARRNGEPSPAVRWRDDVRAILTRQQLLRERAGQLDAEAGEAFLDLAQQQRTLANEVRQQLLTWAGSPVLRQGLQRTVEPMDRAAAALDERRNQDASAAMDLCLRRLGELLDALGSAAEQAPPPAAGAQQQDPAIPSDQSRGAGMRLAELKMIATLQDDLLARTVELDAARQRRGLTPSELQELQGMAGSQQQLASWLDELIDDSGETSGPRPSSIDQLQDALDLPDLSQEPR